MKESYSISLQSDSFNIVVTLLQPLHLGERDIEKVVVGYWDAAQTKLDVFRNFFRYDMNSEGSADSAGRISDPPRNRLTSTFMLHGNYLCDVTVKAKGATAPTAVLEALEPAEEATEASDDAAPPEEAWPRNKYGVYAYDGNERHARLVASNDKSIKINPGCSPDKPQECLETLELGGETLRRVTSSPLTHAEYAMAAAVEVLQAHVEERTLPGLDEYNVQRLAQLAAGHAQAFAGEMALTCANEQKHT